MPSYFPQQDDNPRRRAGLRSDELLPGESNEYSGTREAIGTPGGGLASGGLGGTNAADGAPGDDDLADAMTSGIFDHSGDKAETDEPESGHAGGAVGGTPAGKRAGPRVHDPR